MTRRKQRRKHRRYPAHGYRPVELPLPGEKRGCRPGSLWVCIAGAVLGSGAGLFAVACHEAGIFGLPGVTT